MCRRRRSPSASPRGRESARRSRRARIGRPPAVRQELLDPPCGMGVDALEDVGEVLDGIDAALVARVDQCVEHGVVEAGGLVADEEEVGAPHRRAAEGALGAVVVGRQRDVAREERQRAAVLQEVRDGAREGRARVMPATLAAGPTKDQREDRPGGAELLNGSRWALLKAPENLRSAERLRLADVARLNRRVFRSYLLKEELRTLYRCTVASAADHLRAWCAWASRSKLRPFVKLVRTLRKHSDGVLAPIRLGVSNGRLEGLNNKISVLKHRAYGFHFAAALIAMIYLTCTKLSIELLT